MTPTQARKILSRIAPLKGDEYILRDTSGLYLDRDARDAVATLINALLAEPPAVERALKRLLLAAMKVTNSTITWDAITEAGVDYAEAVKDAKAKARRANR